MNRVNLADTRITRKFDQLKSSGEKAFVAFVTAGDPDFDTSLQILESLPTAGADIIEVGMPFSDPMADGPSIQASSLRALRANMTLEQTLLLVDQFRKTDNETPIVLMGYYNPIYRYGPDKFVHECAARGVDGLIVVDLPPEEDRELCDPALTAGLHWIRLVTPTTDDERIASVLKNVSGFVYYISVLGVTGTKEVVTEQVSVAVDRLRNYTDLPIAVGFGIKTPERAKAVSEVADGIVIGSAIVDLVQNNIDLAGTPEPELLTKVKDFVSDISKSIHLKD